MHKSMVFTYGFIPSSLVLLSSISLFNNNTVTMAQGYDRYGESPYGQYSTYDKKY